MPATPVPPSVKSTPVSASAASHPPDSPLTSNSPPLSAPYISLIGTAAFVHACKLPGATNFTLYIHAEEAKLCSASASPPVDTPNLSGVPQEYHNFVNVFSKAKATTLILHHEYDLCINLEEDASPLLGTVYSLSQTKLGHSEPSLTSTSPMASSNNPPPLMEPLFYLFAKRMVLSAFVSITED